MTNTTDIARPDQNDDDFIAAYDARTPAQRTAHTAWLRQQFIDALQKSQDDEDAKDIAAGRAPREWHLLDRVYRGRDRDGNEVTVTVPHNAYTDANIARARTACGALLGSTFDRNGDPVTVCIPG